jgi:hypothetical protein
MPQYWTERICAAIGDISIIQWAIYCRIGAKCSAHQPVYAMWTMVSNIRNIFTASHFQVSIFNWTYLCCYWRYSDISVRVMLQIWCQIQRTPSSLSYVNCGPRHKHCNYSSAYSGINIQLDVSPLLLEMSRQFNERYTSNLVPNIARILQFTLCELWFRTYTMNLQLRLFRLQYST